MQSGVLDERGRGWREHLGCERYPDARSLTITADSGGSDSHRTRLWKVELQKLADAIGPEIVINLIDGTTTSTGLNVYAQLDDRPDPKRAEVSKEELAAVNIDRDAFHNDWSYTIHFHLLRREPLGR